MSLNTSKSLKSVEQALKVYNSFYYYIITISNLLWITLTGLGLWRNLIREIITAFFFLLFPYYIRHWQLRWTV